VSKLDGEHGGTFRSRCSTVVHSAWKRPQCSATARLERDRRMGRTGEDRERVVHVTWCGRSRHCSTGWLEDNEHAGNRSRSNVLRRTRWQPFMGKRLTCRLTAFSVFWHERSVGCTEQAHALTAKTRSETSDGAEPIWLVFPPRLV
jgi:hypothetical protein